MQVAITMAITITITMATRSAELHPNGIAALIIGSVLLLAACFRPNTAAVSTAAPLRVTPSAITDQLSATPSLVAAAEQLADALDIAPAAVRVRIRPRGCQICTQSENRAASSLAGLAVDEAAAQLQADDDLWLFVEQLTCQYHFDGKTLLPQHCQLSPV